ncbi:deazaflavin-dependent oxidoreductase (nitroreductase family) [Thermosporothrix hazakensis]|jgi:deazaflavin-dependent oxidoreductase (nitroreductase family)|uniref:Deazaflavin-dependent oxidoreductase (Nitroreductase family) n=1 Tax=Thermosporothrix hazakensis TaxID=644383 RepID=A0A326UCS9_THEHA|nr:nitroreductase family deazaflavin-dependent oxidoreductase [Thermosporothrix hazakensis]PZW34305.1 deazaflavin-dependent oxidoreductase (nitroreductase family) [Thermosporothrix hazakensis]GCE46143.1 hypothetical protein KTH_10120 [Thermosporothrix hazakensis]
MSNGNEAIIAEFRANGGKVGGPFEGAPMLLLTTIGAKSGRPHTTPLIYLADGNRLLVFASNAGAPTHPAWFHNLQASPDVIVEVGTDTFPATATRITGEERDRLYARQATIFPAFADYETRTSRLIPVVALQRKQG